MKHIPNILSSLRIVLVGVFAWLFLSAFPDHMTRYWWAIGVYVLAFLTDVLDGFLARTFNWITPVGKLLDPFADKLMVVTALVVILIEKGRQGDMFGIYLALVILIAVKEMLAGKIAAFGEKFLARTFVGRQVFDVEHGVVWLRV